jgi:hypothetical protein
VSCEHGNKPSGSKKCREFHDLMRNSKLLGKLVRCSFYHISEHVTCHRNITIYEACIQTEFKSRLFLAVQFTLFRNSLIGQ